MQEETGHFQTQRIVLGLQYGIAFDLSRFLAHLLNIDRDLSGGIAREDIQSILKKIARSYGGSRSMCIEIAGA